MSWLYWPQDAEAEEVRIEQEPQNPTDTLEAAVLMLEYVSSVNRKHWNLVSPREWEQWLDMKNSWQGSIAGALAQLATFGSVEADLLAEVKQIVDTMRAGRNLSPDALREREEYKDSPEFLKLQKKQSEHARGVGRRLLERLKKLP